MTQIGPLSGSVQANENGPDLDREISRDFDKVCNIFKNYSGTGLFSGGTGQFWFTLFSTVVIFTALIWVNSAKETKTGVTGFTGFSRLKVLCHLKPFA